MLRSLPLFVTAILFLAPSPVKAVKVGDTVLAWWEPNKVYFVGTAVEKSGPGYLIVFEDGDQAVIPATKIRPFNLKVGSAVFARWTDGQYYSGKVVKAVGRAFYIHYADGDKLWVPWSWIAIKP